MHLRAMTILSTNVRMRGGEGGEKHIPTRSVAFSAICTHLDCTVQFREDLSRIWCACHNGHFDLTGRNVEGPPPRPLDAFEVNVRGDEIVVSRKT